MGGRKPAVLEETSEGCTATEQRAVVPWLVKRYYEIDEEDFNIKKINYALDNIFKPNKESCGEFIHELTRTTFYQKPSHQGWLIIVCDEKDHDYTQSSRNYGDCFLWNPITDETIQLPSLLEFYKGNYRFKDCVLSSPPHSDNDSMVLFFGFNRDEEDDYTFLFCRPGEKQWRIHKLSPDMEDLLCSPESVLCFKGKLYLMCADYEHVDENLDHHLEIQHFMINDTDLAISIKSFHVKKEVLFPVEGKTYSKSHYVESHDELFRVDVIYNSGSCEIVSIELVRLNFTLMEWEKVNSLGDHVLFFGHHTTAWSSAAEIGLKSGCLYCCAWFTKGLHRVEIESTGNIVTLLSRHFSCTDWVIMPVNEQGTTENMLRSQDEENGFLLAPETETSTWMVVNKLNEDIVGPVEDHLHGSDYYKHFLSETTSFVSPLLMFSRDHNYNIFSAVNPLYDKENYVMKLSDLVGFTIRFQKGGWLLMTRKNNIIFYNPFTREMMKLPDMDREYCYAVVSFSSLPTSSDCIVFAMDEMTNQVCIDFIKRGEGQWSSRIYNNTHTDSFPSPFIDTAFFHDGAFFCVDYRGTVGVFNSKDNSWEVFEQPLKGYMGDSSPGFLVECDGDLLLVKLEFHSLPVRIFKLDFSEMEWEKVESLGDHMLFISHTSCVSTVAPNSYMKNIIYFPRLHLNGGGIVFYSLDTSSYHTLGSQHAAKDISDTEGWFRNCTWIEPNRSTTSNIEELDWLKTPFLCK